MLQKLSLKDLDLKGKRVLMRVDFNVPLDAKGEVVDDTRIRATLPSIKYVLNAGASLILMSHLGRPKGKLTPEFSLAPCAKRLAVLLGKPVQFANDCIGPEVAERARHLKPGEILLLENLRFHRGEEHPEEDPEFVNQLASLGDLYVNDAFGTAHREHASTASLARLFSGRSAAGFLMAKEIEILGDILTEPKRPFYAIIGGAKVGTKLGILKALLNKVDALMIGGGMAYTFLKARGYSIGNSLVDNEALGSAKELMDACVNRGVQLLLPVDHVVAKNQDPATAQVVDKGIPEGFQGVDIGPKTIAEFAELLENGATVFWNGPLGICEQEQFAVGTRAIAKICARLPAVTIVGGGDSVAALQAAGLVDQITHVSTGGGAALEFIEYGHLPGIDALSNKIQNKK